MAIAIYLWSIPLHRLGDDELPLELGDQPEQDISIRIRTLAAKIIADPGKYDNGGRIGFRLPSQLERLITTVSHSGLIPGIDNNTDFVRQAASEKLERFANSQYATVELAAAIHHNQMILYAQALDILMSENEDFYTRIQRLVGKAKMNNDRALLAKLEAWSLDYTLQSEDKAFDVRLMQLFDK